MRKPGDMSVLVKRSGAVIDDEVAKSYVKAKTVVDPLVEEYCHVYYSDLSERLGIDNHGLPAPLVTTLLNPLFGTRTKVEDPGLMTEGQHSLAHCALLCKIEDNLDEKFPPEGGDTSSRDDDSKDDDTPGEDSNY